MISNFLTTIFESISNKNSIFWEKTLYLLYLLKKVFSTYDKYDVFLQKTESLSGKTLKDRSQAFGDHDYPACQMDENRIKPGSNSNAADKRVAEPSRAEFLTKIFCIQCLNDSYKNIPRISSLLGKIVIFLYTGKNYTSIRF